MTRFPYMPNPPFPYYKNYPKYQSQLNGFIPKQNCNSNDNKNNLNKQHILNETNNLNENKSNSNNADYMFDLFGLKLYFDDVLIVSLLYFLYTQGIKDEGLFLVLILLLIT